MQPQDSQDGVRRERGDSTDDISSAFTEGLANSWESCQRRKGPRAEWRQVIWAEDGSAGIRIPVGTCVSSGSSVGLRSSPHNARESAQAPGLRQQAK